MFIKDAFWSVLAPAIWAYATDSSNWKTTNFIVAMLIALSIFLLLQWLRARSKYTESLGIVSEKGSNDAISAVSESTSQFYFLGISGSRTVNNVNFELAVVKLARSGANVRFLLLDPSSPLVAKRAGDEGSSAEVWEHDIKATTRRLRDIAIRHSVTIEVKYYDEYPIWRMLVVDRKSIYLNYYLDRKRFTDSPQVIMKKTETGLVNPYVKYFDNLWGSAVAV